MRRQSNKVVPGAVLLCPDSEGVYLVLRPAHSYKQQWDVLVLLGDPKRWMLEPTGGVVQINYDWLHYAAIAL